MELKFFVLSFDHVEHSMASKLIYALSIAEPLFAIFGRALDHSVYFMHSAVGASVFGQVVKIVGLNRSDV